MKNLLWLQTGACSGDTLSLLNADGPSLESLINGGTIELLWHPSLTAEPAGYLAGLIRVTSKAARAASTFSASRGA